MANTTLNDIYLYAGSENTQFSRNRERWQFLLESFEGGEVYRKGQHLTRYALETAAEYAQRCRSTPLDNHCRSVINVYVSFLFRVPPYRDFASWAGMTAIEDFLTDADLDGRSLDAVMKEVSTWASVFGHAWLLLAKPPVESAVSAADQQNAGARSYVTMLTPLVVTDWRWERTPQGRYELSYFKYVEDVNDSVITVREWTLDTITTYILDDHKKTAQVDTVETNQLGVIPAVLVYNQRSQVRGIGISDITDIADQQRAIYNELSEVEQSIRLEGHPSLVLTPDCQMGSGAGAIIQMPENLDPGLKPYVLNIDSAPVGTIYDSIQNRVQSIDRMANTGTVRATETRNISGVAMKTEFQLLNARLSEKGDNLELAEEQLWRLWGLYERMEWTGQVIYPESYDIRDSMSEYQALAQARAATANPQVQAVIDYKLMEVLDEEPEEVQSAMAAYTMTDPAVEAQVVDSVVSSLLPDYPEHWMVAPDGHERMRVSSEMVHQALVDLGWTHDTEMRITD